MSDLCSRNKASRRAMAHHLSSIDFPEVSPRHAYLQYRCQIFAKATAAPGIPRKLRGTQLFACLHDDPSGVSGGPVVLQFPAERSKIQHRTGCGNYNRSTCPAIEEITCSRALAGATLARFDADRRVQQNRRGGQNACPSSLPHARTRSNRQDSYKTIQRFQFALKNCASSLVVQSQFAPNIRQTAPLTATFGF
jgi:hypothetical protein